jgi:hypothetical protein
VNVCAHVLLLHMYCFYALCRAACNVDGAEVFCALQAALHRGAKDKWVSVASDAKDLAKPITLAARECICKCVCVCVCACVRVCVCACTLQAALQGRCDWFRYEALE